MPRIPDEVVQRLKEEVDLAVLVTRSGVALKKTGKDLVGRCPFHDDRTPSLVVTPAKGLWHCMGACQTGGTAIDWVMKSAGVSFRHAVELLDAGEAPAVTPGKALKVSTRRRLAVPIDTTTDDAEALTQVVAYYHETLLKSPEALAYLGQRKLDRPEVVERFRLGYANRTLGLRLPDKQRVAGKEIRGRLERLGIFRSTGHEHLRGSLVVPVTDPEGKILDLYGRKIRSDLHPDIPLHLYLPGPHKGIFNAEGFSGGEVIVAESLIDALSFYAFGFENVTATYGTGGWTEAHDAALATYGVTRVLLAFDADDAGERPPSSWPPPSPSGASSATRCGSPRAPTPTTWPGGRRTPATPSVTWSAGPSGWARPSVPPTGARPRPLAPPRRQCRPPPNLFLQLLQPSRPPRRRPRQSLWPSPVPR